MPKHISKSKRSALAKICLTVSLMQPDNEYLQGEEFLKQYVGVISFFYERESKLFGCKDLEHQRSVKLFDLAIYIVFNKKDKKFVTYFTM